MAQERLWITEPLRATCLANVTAVRGNEFAVDKALFAPRSSACRHPQNHDEGTVWWDGEKRRLATVRDAGDVWYSLRGTVPSVGATLQCHLNQAIRNLASRAHSAMHLFLSELPRDAPPLLEHPEVKGGGHFRLTFGWPVAPDVLAGTLQAVARHIASDVPTVRTFMTKAEAARVVVRQSFQPPDEVPGPDVVSVVTVGGLAMPCDGSHVARTSDIGRLVISHAAAGKTGFVVGGRVVG